ncbi:PhoP regulatory network YrbL family protein [Microbulbifer sp. OS29]|uniref:PhoP regulatory network YrbL family protein n=1 Tax=Microbulbifer okhotskensis TaxID=2926617 RepID=A0A9X2EJE6_9GAMM|nr:YrbL family protein [Microbulbifer okhotskensis]MCO1333364.1 PhoP regulatory network YrbL family protein [Microbulbifer okhotskensis]
MIDLSQSEPFASGGNRFCYRHPEQPEICVKVMRPGRTAELLGRAPWYKTWRGQSYFDDNLRELEGYNQRVITTGRDGLWLHLPRWYGMQETSLGPAAVTDMILESDGHPAPTLRQYLNKYGLTPEIRTSLREFSEWLLEYEVLTKNLIAHNLVLQKQQGKVQVYLIDGLGCSTFLALPKISSYFAKRYIRRRIERMWLRVEWEISDKEIPWRKYEAEGLRR